MTQKTQVPLLNWIKRVWRGPDRPARDEPFVRGKAIHVVILDGTASSLDDGWETNVGLTYELLKERKQDGHLTLYYEPGIQWDEWRATWDVLTGRGINRQIRRAYGALCNRYRAGDQIILIGYSRGAYAVRSLAGVIDRVGLLKSKHATVRHIENAYRHYEAGGGSDAAAVFREEFCHDKVVIEAVAVWDTVKALGFRLPVIWRYSMQKHDFHDHALGPSIKNGFHALAYDEKRLAYAPVMWLCPPEWKGHMEQVWFRGTHSDVGGQLRGHFESRPLANISLVWMLERLEGCGLQLPDDWRSRFPQDVNAPSLGAWHGWSKLLWARRRRVVGVCTSERLHETIAERPASKAAMPPAEVFVAKEDA